MEKKDLLKLNNQICFPLYVASKEVIKKYKPYLEKLNLTYTQYITMMVMWEYERINVKELGKKIFLDSGTLTPLLKKLESKNYIIRQKLKSDERSLIITLTTDGIKLKEQAKSIPLEMIKCLNLSNKELINLKKILEKIIGEK